MLMQNSTINMKFITSRINILFFYEVKSISLINMTLETEFRRALVHVVFIRYVDNRTESTYL